MSSFEKEKQLWDRENRPIGEQLGYPKCCIDAFCAQPPALMAAYPPSEDDRTRFRASLINGQQTGFIPCINHAKQVLDKKITLSNLISDRNPSLPIFPNL